MTLLNRLVGTVAIGLLCMLYLSQPIASFGQADAKAAMRIRELKAEREKLLQRVAAIDAELGRLEPKNSRLPKPLEKIPCDVTPFDDLFEVVGVKVTREPEFSDRQTVMWTLKARRDLTWDVRHNFFSNREAVFYRQGNGAELRLSDHLLKHTDLGANTLKEGASIEAWLFLANVDQAAKSAIRMAIEKK
ncbi:MAG: hypothetical protein ACKV2Q_14690 [Planctomycetaceae bacterium]